MLAEIIGINAADVSACMVSETLMHGIDDDSPSHWYGKEQRQTQKPIRNLNTKIVISLKLNTETYIIIKHNNYLRAYVYLSN